jgi:hypothetical protein
MHRPATHSTTGTSRSARSSRTLVAAWAARTTHQRLARTHCAAIDRLPGNWARRTSGSLRARHSRARGGRWRPCKFCHQIGPRRYHRARDRLACKIRFRGRTQRTAAARRGSARSDNGSRRTGSSRVSSRMKRSTRLLRRRRSPGPRHRWRGRLRRRGARSIARCRGLCGLRGGKRLPRPSENLAWPRRGRSHTRWYRNSFGSHRRN